MTAVILAQIFDMYHNSELVYEFLQLRDRAYIARPFSAEILIFVLHY